MIGSWRLRMRLSMLALGLSATLGCTGLPERPDILVITIDTARADRFSYAGESPVPTPRIDALASESTAFLDAVAPAPITLVSHASLFTGLLPPAHGVRNNGTYRLGDSVTTLAELLRERGYRTGAFVGAAVLDSKYGLDQGFEHYDDRVDENKHRPERRGENVVQAALDWLEGKVDEPTFAWVHLFDPHSPYQPPEPERSSYPGAPYDGEIAYVDRVVGQLLDGYRRRDRYRHLVVVLTADHGESLGEHGETSHGVFLYDATLRVPFLIRVPGVGEGLRVASQVQLIDVVPTLTELLGLEAPAGAAGRSLLAALRGAPLDPQPAYAESLLSREDYGWSELRGLRAGGWKLVLGVEAELYDLSGDPDEVHDLAAAEPERLRSMQRIFETQISEVGEIVAERFELDDETRRQLAALGYLSTSPSEPGEDPATGAGELPDPRQMIHLSRALSTSQELFDRGFHRQAIERAEAILQEDPSNILVRTQLSSMLLATGGIDQAERHLSMLIRQEPVAGGTWRLLATVRERTGRYDEASAAYRSAHQTDSTDVEARARAWELRLAAGDRDGVRDEVTETLESDPNDVGARVFMAVARWRPADPERLLSELRTAAERTPGDAEVLAALGDAHSARGDYSSALPLHAEAQMLLPGSSRYAIRLARTLAALGRPGDVRHLLWKVDKRQRFDPEVWLLLGEACQALGDRVCAARALSRVSALVPGPLTPFLDRLQRGRTPSADAGQERVELLLLAGRSEEAQAEVEAPERLFAGATEQSILAASALLKRGDAATVRQALERGYRQLDLSAALVYAISCARADEPETVREILTLLSEILVSGEGPTWLSEPSRQDRLAATAALVQIGSESWQRYEYWNAVHAYAIGAHLVADDPRPHYNLGLAWERVGDFREAREAFRRTLELDPNFPRAREHQAALISKTGVGSDRE